MTRGKLPKLERNDGVIEPVRSRRAARLASYRFRGYVAPDSERVRRPLRRCAGSIVEIPLC